MTLRKHTIILPLLLLQAVEPQWRKTASLVQKKKERRRSRRLQSALIYNRLQETVKEITLGGH